MFLINNVLYLIQGKQPTDTFRSLITILGTAIFLLGFAAFYASMAPPAGVLLALIVPVPYLTGVLDFITPVLILLSFGVWVWLGWILTSQWGAAMETT